MSPAAARAVPPRARARPRDGDGRLPRRPAPPSASEPRPGEGPAGLRERGIGELPGTENGDSYLSAHPLPLRPSGASLAAWAARSSGAVPGDAQVGGGAGGSVGGRRRVCRAHFSRTAGIGPGRRAVERSRERILVASGSNGLRRAKRRRRAVQVRGCPHPVPRRPFRGRRSCPSARPPAAFARGARPAALLLGGLRAPAFLCEAELWISFQTSCLRYIFL